jgi:hypothetical protein
LSPPHLSGRFSAGRYSKDPIDPLSGLSCYYKLRYVDFINPSIPLWGYLENIFGKIMLHRGAGFCSAAIMPVFISNTCGFSVSTDIHREVLCWTDI